MERSSNVTEASSQFKIRITPRTQPSQAEQTREQVAQEAYRAMAKEATPESIAAETIAINRAEAARTRNLPPMERQRIRNEVMNAAARSMAAEATPQAAEEEKKIIEAAKAEGVIKPTIFKQLNNLMDSVEQSEPAETLQSQEIAVAKAIVEQGQVGRFAAWTNALDADTILRVDKAYRVPKIIKDRLKKAKINSPEGDVAPIIVGERWNVHNVFALSAGHTEIEKALKEAVQTTTKALPKHASDLVKASKTGQVGYKEEVAQLKALLVDRASLELTVKMAEGKRDYDKINPYSGVLTVENIRDMGELLEETANYVGKTKPVVAETFASLARVSGHIADLAESAGERRHAAHLKKLEESVGKEGIVSQNQIQAAVEKIRASGEFDPQKVNTAELADQIKEATLDRVRTQLEQNPEAKSHLPEALRRKVGAGEVDDVAAELLNRSDQEFTRRGTDLLVTMGLMNQVLTEAGMEEDAAQEFVVFLATEQALARMVYLSREEEVRANALMLQWKTLRNAFDSERDGTASEKIIARKLMESNIPDASNILARSLQTYVETRVGY